MQLSITGHASWAILHGMILGALFLLFFTGAWVGIHGLRADWQTEQGSRAQARRLRWGLWAMALLAWAACLVGTYIVYPWYRATPPAGLHELSAFPRSMLLASPRTARWHEFGMEWKEHLAWFAPLFATTAAVIVSRYGPKVALDPKLRRTLELLLTLAFLAAAGAGFLGALISKVAPVH